MLSRPRLASTSQTNKTNKSVDVGTLHGDAGGDKSGYKGRESYLTPVDDEHADGLVDDLTISRENIIFNVPKEGFLRGSRIDGVEV